MLGETLKMEKDEAISIYGWFITLIVFSQIVGALLGDLLIGNKKSIIIGGIIQAVGAFSLCLPSTTGLYLGLFLVISGNGLFTPNLISNFGKTYLNKTKLLDSGFTVLYLAANLGSFLGVAALGYLSEKFGYSTGFAISGILMLCSIVPMLISKERTPRVQERKITMAARFLNIFIAVVAIGLFWGFYEVSGIRAYNLHLQFTEISPLGITSDVLQSLNFYLILFAGIIACVWWTYFYSNQFFKLMLGFVFGAVSIGILFVIPEVPTEQHIIAYLVSMLLIAIAEIFIAPIVHSVLTKYSNPKYLATFISLAFLPVKLISLVLGLFHERFNENTTLALNIGFFGMTVTGLGLIGYVIWRSRRPELMETA